MKKRIAADALSIKHMRKLGYIVEKVEKRVSIPGGTSYLKDLYGFIDVLCVGNGETVAIQCTSRDAIAKRIRKIEHEDLAEKLAAVRDAGWKLLVQGWDQPGGKGKPYRLKEVDIS